MKRSICIKLIGVLGILFLSSYSIIMWSQSKGNDSYGYKAKDRAYVRFRVAQWNIGKLNMGRPGVTSITKDQREAKVLEYNRIINRVRADIFCFNEYSPYFSLKDSLNEDTLDYTRTAILSMYNNCQYGKRYGANCNCIAVAGFKLKNFYTVIYKNKKQNRYYSVSDLIINGNIVKIVSTHLDLSKYEAERKDQIQELLSSFEKSPYVIICGDFNVKNASEYDLFIEHGYRMANHGPLGDLVTFPIKKGGYILDNIICKGFDIMGIDIYKTSLSDHYIIACDAIMRQ